MLYAYTFTIGLMFSTGVVYASLLAV